MQTPPETEPGVELVVAAQRGDQSALDALAAAYLPLVYNIAGRAMNGHPDVDDVVQETMLRAIRGIDQLREPEAFRSWLVAIAIRQVRDSFRARPAQAPAVADEGPSPDFADRTVQRLGLSGQRRETAEAARWLDDEDRPVLALWWQEAAGGLSRAEVADALGVSQAHAAVRIARMKERLATSRTVVRALAKVPPCPSLAAVTAGWGREPSPLWRKRLARHVRDCAWCLSDASDMVPAEGLLGGLPLLPVPAALAGAVLKSAVLTSGTPASGTPASGTPASGPPAGDAAGRGLAGRRLTSRARGAHAQHTRRTRRTRQLLRAVAAFHPKLVAVAVTVATLTACGVVAAVHVRPAAAPAVLSMMPTLPASQAPLAAQKASSKKASKASPKPSHKPTPRPSHRPTPRPTHKPTPKPTPTSRPSSRPTPTPTPPVTVVSQRKGVATWDFAGVSQALSQSGASWYYNWWPTPSGPAPSSVQYVPMIRSAANVDPATLAEVKQEGSVLLGFNEPDMGNQANMSVAQALSLWPQLMATGMTLGSPAVSSGAATPGGWLDQFMAGANARGYRVNFITVHWYGGDFRTGPAVQELESYLQAIYARYHLPIWLTEFALIGYNASGAFFPAQAQQAAFLTAATAMLDSLSYVQRYAWFALPTSPSYGSTGLFNPGPSVTQVGQAFEAAR